MNKILVLIAILVSFSGFAQQLIYHTGGNVYDMNNQKIKPDAVRELLKKNEQTLATYNAGRNKKTWGNVLFYGGIGLATINLVSAVTMDTAGIDGNGNYYSKKSTPTLAIIGGAMVVASIPIKVGYTRKIKNAIDRYNQDITATENIKTDISLLASNNGIGLKIAF